MTTITTAIIPVKIY